MAHVMNSKLLATALSIMILIGADASDESLALCAIDGDDREAPASDQLIGRAKPVRLPDAPRATQIFPSEEILPPKICTLPLEVERPA